MCRFPGDVRRLWLLRMQLQRLMIILEVGDDHPSCE